MTEVGDESEIVEVPSLDSKGSDELAELGRVCEGSAQFVNTSLLIVVVVDRSVEDGVDHVLETVKREAQTKSEKGERERGKEETSSPSSRD